LDGEGVSHVLGLIGVNLSGGMNMKPTWEPKLHKTKYIFFKKKTKKVKYKNLKMTHRDRTADKNFGHLQIQPQRNELTKFAKKEKKKKEQKGNPQIQRRRKGRRVMYLFLLVSL
jgi:hypothetical protein